MFVGWTSIYHLFWGYAPGFWLIAIYTSTFAYIYIYAWSFQQAINWNGVFFNEVYTWVYNKTGILPQNDHVHCFSIGYWYLLWHMNGKYMICNQHYLICGILWSESMVLNAYYQLLSNYATRRCFSDTATKKCAPQRSQNVMGSPANISEMMNLRDCFFDKKTCSYDSYDSYHVHSRDFDVSPFSEALFAKGLPKQLGRGNFFG